MKKSAPQARYTAEIDGAQTGQPARRIRDLRYRALVSGSCERRVVGKAAQLPGKTSHGLRGRPIRCPKGQKIPPIGIRLDRLLH